MLPKILHLEPTDACNAACPQCLRETDRTFNKKNVHHLTVEKIQSLKIDITALDKMFMCGNYGDPAAGKYTIKLYQYFRDINPTIALGMNTNGGLRSGNWWAKLAKLLCQQHDYVVFSIDGLKDINQIYRINVNWDTLMRNVNTFIQSGGNAHWDMLIFEHNQHQVEEAKQLAKDLGFKWFRAKVSKRFETFPVSFLRPPKGWSDPVVKKGTIECTALKESSLYVSANGIAYPCCWLGNTTYDITKFDSIKESWDSEPNITCTQTCSTNRLGSSFTNQWQLEVEF